MKLDKNTINLIDKITIKYITSLTNKSTTVCTEYGKKTITVTHILETLKKEKLDSHLKKLQTELDLNEDEEEEVDTKRKMKELKVTINSKKRKGNKEKKTKKIVMTEEMMNEQAMLFEKSKLEAYDLMVKEQENERREFGKEDVNEENEENEENYD